MRAGFSTIQQTLTPEAASVLNQSIAEAARRSHSQTTPLHVAATLLASPTGLFRLACIRSHPNSSHPLQCRALELCFSVALDRLPSSAPSNSNPSATSSSTQSGGGNASVSSSNATAGSPALALEQPPISNALMAALKRAQAHQRRGCPEQQQQPLLAVKVELEQLVISILDDPSVSRVMREASFSSPAVKATIQQSLVVATPSSVTTTTFSPSPSASPDSRPVSNAAAGGHLGGLRPSLAAPGAPLLPANRNLYLNPRLQQQQPQPQGSGGGSNGFEHHRREEVKRVLDILLRAKKRNPVLVSDSLPDSIMKEVLHKIERREVGEGPLRNVEVMSLEKQLASDISHVPLKLQELGNSIDLRFRTGDTGGVAGVILDLGDLKWLVESPGGGVGGSSGSTPIQQQQQQKVVLEIGRAAVAEMAKLLGRFADGTSGGRIWLVGTATCATYLRCQVYHPTMENDWDLQAVPIAAGTPVPGMFPRVGGGKGILSSSVESLSTQKGFSPIGATTITARRPLENMDPSPRSMCPVCTEGYERELAKLVAGGFEKSSAESKPEPRHPLPPWLQLANVSNGNAKPPASQLQTKEQELKRKQNTEELFRRWTETCSRLHPSFHQAAGGHDKPTPLLPMSNLGNSNLLLRQSFQTKLPPARSCGSPLQVSNQSSHAATGASGRHASAPGSPVRTDLVLGRAKPSYEKSPEDAHRQRLQDPAGCTPDGFSQRQRDKVAGNVDLDSFKRLFKGLTEKVTWQPEAASLVAATVIQCKSGDSRRRSAGARGDAWLLFMGPDKVGKKKMAMALSELVVGSGPVTVSFGDSQVGGDSIRGKTALDRVVEAVHRNPFSVVVLEDVDRADMLVQGNLKRAMERGRLPDSHGREIALGSVIFVMISHALPENLKPSIDTLMQCEEKLSAAANSGIQLELVVGDKPGKRRAEWVPCEDDDRVARPRKQTAGQPGLSLDLNLAAACEEATECSPNTSDLTVEHEHNECGRLAFFNRVPQPTVSELVGAVDEAIVFKPVDFGEIRRKVSDGITRKFKSVVCDGQSLWIDEAALDRVVGGVWFGATPASGFEEWTERVLVPSFQQLRSRVAAVGSSTVVRLLLVKDGYSPRSRGGDGAGPGGWLPSKVTVAVDGLGVLAERG